MPANPPEKLTEFVEGGGGREKHKGTSYSPFVLPRYQVDSHFDSNLGLWISVQLASNVSIRKQEWSGSTVCFYSMRPGGQSDSGGENQHPTDPGSRTELVP